MIDDQTTFPPDRSPVPGRGQNRSLRFVIFLVLTFIGVAVGAAWADRESRGVYDTYVSESVLQIVADPPQTAETLRALARSATVIAPVLKQNHQFGITDMAPDALTQMVSESIDVRSKAASVFTLQVRHTNPETCPAIANGMANALLSFLRDSQQSSSQDVVELLVKAKDELHNSIIVLEEQYAELRQMNLGDDSAELLKHWQEESHKLRVAVAAIESDTAWVQQAIQNGTPDRTINRAFRNGFGHASQETEAPGDAGNIAKEEMSGEEILQTLKASHLRATKREVAVGVKLEIAMEEAKKRKQFELQCKYLERQLKRESDLFESVLEHLQETDIVVDRQQATILSTAQHGVRDLTEFYTILRYWMILGAIAGAIFGIIVAMLV